MNLRKNLGMDPLELREINVLRPGDTFPFGQRPDVFPLPAMIRRLRPMYEEALGCDRHESTDTLKRGVGVAVSVYNAGHDGPDKAEAAAELTADGVTVYSCWEDTVRAGISVRWKLPMRPCGKP